MSRDRRGTVVGGNGKMVEEANISKNMYELISSMNLGNLSALKEVPLFYYGCLL